MNELFSLAKSKPIAVGMILVLLVSGASTQEIANGTPRHEIVRTQPDQNGISRDQANAILEELRQIRHLLESDVQSASNNEVQHPRRQVQISSVPETYVLGKRDAPVTLIEFMDYQCPFCRQFQHDVFSKLKREYIDTGKVRFISLDMPLSFHANALTAAEAVRCAGEQGKYWEMRESLLLHSDDLARSSVLKYAQDAGVETDKLSSCIDSEKYKSAVQKDSERGNSLSVSGTPAFIVAKTESEELVGNMTVGNVPFATLEEEIKPLLVMKTTVENGMLQSCTSALNPTTR